MADLLFLVVSTVALVASIAAFALLIAFYVRL